MACPVANMFTSQEPLGFVSSQGPDQSVQVMADGAVWGHSLGGHGASQELSVGTLLKNLSLHGFPKQPSVPWRSKGQNPELWPAGPALLLALCKPAGP